MIARAFLLAIAGFATWSAVGLRSALDRAPVSPASLEILVPVQGTVIPAFPECVGYGCIAFADTNTALAISASGSPSSLGNRNVNCRGKPYKAIFVSNLNQTGAGSLHDAWRNQVSNSFFNFIMFTVGGTIIYDGSLIISRANCIYLGGQTAPAGGIQFTHFFHVVKNCAELSRKFFNLTLGQFQPS